MSNASGVGDRRVRVGLVGSQFVESYTEMVRAAYAEPRLRQLFPWTGMWELHFSRCTEVRHT